jgi:ATP-dependent Clp protease ATP-binding subunit ClpC
MLEYSPGIVLAWQVAAVEAKAAQQEFIEREHLFMGAMKLLEIPAEAIPDELGNTDLLREETRRLDEMVRDFHLDGAKARRRLRQLVGTGERHWGDQDLIHRSPASRETFARATAQADKTSCATHLLHVLAALLVNPGVRVAQAIAASGGDLDGLRSSAWQRADDLQVHLAPTAAAGAQAKSKKYLDRFGTDLTQVAESGAFEPMIGRGKELLQVIRTLSRKSKNNPLLLGDPGVGKTAIVRALAQRIASGKIPSPLAGKRIIEISLGALVAGTKYRGEFEERLTRIMEEVNSRPEVILFIDEIHTMVGAGSAEGGLDAANVLKPALAGSDFRCIGSTTLAEYRKYFEKDQALARRFQPVVIEEPSPDETLQILEGLRERYQSHHKVKIASSALRAAVELSCRHLLDRHLPDKAIDLLDEACVRIKIGSVSFRQNEPEASVAGPVTAETIAAVVSEWTGIPATRLSAEGQMRLKDMASILRGRIIGQDGAISKVTNVVTLAKAGLRDKRRPVGVFLFMGPTGVGKTELAKALAEFLFGSEKDLIRLDMSEYMEKHSVSRLIGAPPGYVGHDEEGQLTGRLRRKPYSVVLLDEIEKAHPEVCDLFLQLFDEGRLTDSHGRTVDGKNAIFIMTSNLAVTESETRPIGFLRDEPEVSPRAQLQTSAIVEDLRRSFRPEFLNRIDEVVVFRPLSMEHLSGIAQVMLAALSRSVADQQNIGLRYSGDVACLVAREGFDPANGARPLARAIERLVSRPLSQKIISGEFKPGDQLECVVASGQITFQHCDADSGSTH